MSPMIHALLKDLLSVFLEPPITECPRCGHVIRERPSVDDHAVVDPANVNLLAFLVILGVVLVAVVGLAESGRLWPVRR